jgi:threonine/homoserine/homoserine lactone efflux protein
MSGDIFALTAIGAALLLGAMSPGASFLLVARSAMSCSRRAALFVSLGMGIGSLMFAIIALAGLHTLLTLVPSLYTALKIAGACYLLWLAIKMFRQPAAGRMDFSSMGKMSGRKALMTGLITQVSNPHTALVFASIFTTALTSEIKPYMYFALPVMAFLIDYLWYVVVACLLSTHKPRQAYVKYRKFIDRLSGGFMAWLGIHVLMK